MFVKAGIAAALLAAFQSITIPFGTRTKGAEPPRAPIETAGPRWARECGDDTGWDKPAPPVRIHGNTYYVGTCGITALLITGPSGYILIDSGTEKGADLVIANIRALGLNPRDVRYLLHSHEHLDHVGGMARLQQLTGAALISSRPAARVFATGAPSGDDPQTGMHPPFPAVQPTRTIGDGEIIQTRDIALTAIATPGHTPGALSWRWTSCDGGSCRIIVYADSLSPISRDDYRFSDHPAYLASYRASIAKIADSPCEILVTPHPSASGLKERFAAGKTLLDEQGCKAYAAKLTTMLDERLAKEAAAKK